MIIISNMGQNSSLNKKNRMPIPC